jgi:hypothetical protein
MSLLGNAASAFVGSIIMALVMMLWHYSFDEILGGTFSIYNIIANYILMYLGTSLIELLIIKLTFKYSFKELLIPVLAGNLVTYVLLVVFKFHNELKLLFKIR